MVGLVLVKGVNGGFELVLEIGEASEHVVESIGEGSEVEVGIAFFGGEETFRGVEKAGGVESMEAGEASKNNKETQYDLKEGESSRQSTQ